MRGKRSLYKSTSKVLDAEPFKLRFRMMPYQESCPDNGPRIPELAGGYDPYQALYFGAPSEKRVRVGTSPIRTQTSVLLFWGSLPKIGSGHVFLT